MGLDEGLFCKVWHGVSSILLVFHQFFNHNYEPEFGMLYKGSPVS